MLVMAVSAVSASPVYTFPTTNQLNADELTPGYVGQLTPYVELVETGVGYVDLKFVNAYVGLHYFEYRIDGVVKTSGTPHEFLTPAKGYPNEFEYSGVCVQTTGAVCPTGPVTKRINATEKVEVRLALGAENDWYFDWVTFEVLPQPCTMTFSKPDQTWYNGDIPIEWSYSSSCTLSPDQSINLYWGNGSYGQNIVSFFDTFTRTYTWTPYSFNEGIGLKVCGDTELSGSDAEVEGCSREFGIDFTAPTITADDRTCNEGEQILLTACATDALSGVDDSTWKWDLDGNGIFDDSIGACIEVPYTCKDGPSTETVQVKVSDKAGNEASPKTITMTVANVAPTVTDIIPSGVLYEGSSVTLDATVTDPSSLYGDGDTPMTFYWDTDEDGIFDDSNVLSCSTPDKMSVSVKARDFDGDLSEAYSEGIVCYNAPPTIDRLAITTPILEEETATFTATVHDYGDWSSLSYTINWGDGHSESSVTSGEILATHQYMDNGVYTVTLTITDGDASDEETLSMTVNNIAPWNVSAGADRNIVKGFSKVCFDGVATDVVEDLGHLNYTWDFGNEDSDQSDIGLTHACTTYPERGIYTVTLTVSDGDGGVTTDTLTLGVYDYSISMRKGWNLISIPLVPLGEGELFDGTLEDDTSIENVFSQIDGDIEIVWSYTYDASQGKNVWKHNQEADGWSDSASRVQDIIPGYGYYVYVNEDTTVYLNGEPLYHMGGIGAMPPSVTLAMDSWNLVGTYGSTPLVVPFALWSLTDEENNWYYDVIYDENGHRPMSFIPTEGYWLSVKKIFDDKDTIEYKANYLNFPMPN